MGRGGIVEGLLYALAGLLFLFGYGVPARTLPAFDPAQREPGHLRVVTWNVGGAAGGSSHALPGADVGSVAAALVRLDPDVVVLQELESRSQLDRLREALGAGWHAAMAGLGDVGALVRGPLLAGFELPGPGRRLVALRLSFGSTTVAVCGLHAPAFSALGRNRMIGAALDALLERGDAEARILLGDLNLDIDLDKRRDLFTDDEHADVETYNYVVSRLSDAARGRGPTAEPDRRLDYVFVTEGTLEIHAAGPWKGQRIGSMDHDPVVADLIPRR